MAAKTEGNPRPQRTIAKLWQSLRCGLSDPYRPELHYMRGPGPKWREKHLAQPAADETELPTSAEALA